MMNSFGYWIAPSHFGTRAIGLELERRPLSWRNRSVGADWSARTPVSIAVLSGVGPIVVAPETGHDDVRADLDGLPSDEVVGHRAREFSKANIFAGVQCSLERFSDAGGPGFS